MKAHVRTFMLNTLKINTMTTTVLIFAIVALLVVIWAMSVAHKAELFTSRENEAAYFFKLQATEHYHDVDAMKLYTLQQEFDKLLADYYATEATLDTVASAFELQGVYAPPTTYEEFEHFNDNDDFQQISF